MSGGRSREDEAGAQRLDKWLWFARFARTRTLAAKLCQAGLVAVSGAASVKPNRAVRIGDVLTVTQGRLVRTVAVKGLGLRRGPPGEARLLYEEVAAPVALERDAEGWTPLLADPD
jgi:ribosome-associated heat shock protein Hsp15